LAYLAIFVSHDFEVGRNIIAEESTINLIQGLFILNIFQAHDEQGDNPGQEKRV